MDVSRRGLFRVVIAGSAIAASAYKGVVAETSVEEFDGRWVLAEVKWFNRVREFGSLHIVGEDDLASVFVGLSDVRRSGLETLRPGQRVFAYCEWRRTRPYNGVRATRIELA